MMILNVSSATWRKAIDAGNAVWVEGSRPEEYRVRMDDTLCAALRELHIEIEIDNHVRPGVVYSQNVPE